MKVAYNACYGGFSLSKAAMERLAEIKGVDLSGMEFHYCTFRDGNGGKFECPEDRSDKDLIKVIEELGEIANGTHANLQIAVIPDGADYEIDEYDGFESVEPPRQIW